MSLNLKKQATPDNAVSDDHVALDFDSSGGLRGTDRLGNPVEIFPPASGGIPLAEKGAINGVAPLDSAGRVPAANLPSYVDDILEYANVAAFPATGETGKIYLALNTLQQYRWTGSVYNKLPQALDGPIESSGLTLSQPGLLGRGAAGAGALARIALAGALSLSAGNVLSLTGPIAGSGMSITQAASILYSDTGGAAPIEVSIAGIFGYVGGKLRPQNLTTNHFNVMTAGDVQASLTVNQASAFVAAITAANGRPIWIPEDFRCDEATVVLGPSVPALRLDGPGALRYNKGNTSLHVYGEAGPQVNVTSMVASTLAAGYSPEVTQLIIPSGSIGGFARGDAVKIWCNTLYPDVDDASPGDTCYAAETTTVLGVDTGTNTITVPALYDGTLIAGSSQIAMRKLVPRDVDINVKVSALGNPYANDGLAGRAAVRLYGLVRPKYRVWIENASGQGVRSTSCYEADGTVYLSGLWNGTETGVTATVFGYGLNLDNGDTNSRVQIVATTARHAFGTTFDDTGAAFSHSNWLNYGAVRHPTIEPSVISNATGGAYNTHYHCHFPTFNSPIGIGQHLINGASGSAVFSHRAIGVTVNNGRMFGGDSGYTDISAVFNHARRRTVARYINCESVGARSTGWLFDGDQANVYTQQHAELYGCSVDGRTNSGTRTVTALEIREQSRVVIRGGFRCAGFNNYPIRWNANSAWAGTQELDFDWIEMDYADVGSGAVGMGASASGLRIRVRGDQIIVRGSSTLPADGFFNFGSAPTSLDIRLNRPPISRDRRLRLCGGSIPAGAITYVPGMGAGPNTAYGTIPSIGDANLTILPNTIDVAQYNDPLSVDRTVTVAVGTAPDEWRKGAHVDIVRTEAATGANLTVVAVSGLTAFAAFDVGPGESARLRYDGARLQRVRGATPAASAGGIASYTLATRPAASSLPVGTQIRLTDVGLAPGVVVETTGSRWRPAGGSQVLYSNNAPVAVTGLASLTLVPVPGRDFVVPAGLLGPNAKLTADLATSWTVANTNNRGWLTANAATCGYIGTTTSATAAGFLSFWNNGVTTANTRGNQGGNSGIGGTSSSFGASTINTDTTAVTLAIAMTGDATADGCILNRVQYIWEEA